MKAIDHRLKLIDTMDLTICCQTCENNVELRKLVSYWEKDIRSVFFTNRFISNNLINATRSTVSVFLCFVCLGIKFNDTWQWSEKDQRGDGRVVHVCSSKQGMCKHLSQSHKHVLRYKHNSCKHVANYDECFADVSLYLDGSAWNEALKQHNLTMTVCTDPTTAVVTVLPSNTSLNVIPSEDVLLEGIIHCSIIMCYML